MVKRQGPAPTKYTTPQTKVAIRNVRVFDGRRLNRPATVVIENGLIGHSKHERDADQVIDAYGGVLLPGLIDSHVHTGSVANAETMRNYGISSAMDMGCTLAPSDCDALNVGVGYPQIKFSYDGAVSPFGASAKLGLFKPNSFVTNASTAAAYIARQVTNNASYIKIITESPGLDQATFNAFVADAHGNNKKVMSHAPRHDPVSESLTAQVDFIHHSPTDKPVNESQVQQYLKQKVIAVPTLIQMLTIAGTGFGNSTYPPARDSVTSLYRAGVPILAGSDATGLHIPPNLLVPMGISLHQELELLVEAGLTTVDALRAVTSLPALHFGLPDRGVIAPGYRADLVLIRGNPILNISTTQEIERIWIGGVEFNPFNRTISTVPCDGGDNEED
ncbi:hypothetical protein B0A49_13951 [Cryomyces minteri]|nr:hypothetical protein B0A49_13951 [Cryomyces minteri]